MCSARGWPLWSAQVSTPTLPVPREERSVVAAARSPGFIRNRTDTVVYLVHSLETRFNLPGLEPTAGAIICELHILCELPCCFASA